MLLHSRNIDYYNDSKYYIAAAIYDEDIVHAAQLMILYEST